MHTVIKVGSDGRVPIGTQRLRLERPPGSKVILCLHPSAHHFVLAAAPDPKLKPVLLFTNHPNNLSYFENYAPLTERPVDFKRSFANVCVPLMGNT